MFERYGFEVIPEEQDNMKLTGGMPAKFHQYGLFEEKILVKFVEFWKSVRGFEVTCYYKKNFAKGVTMKDEEVLKKIFPKSFAHGNSGEIYHKVFKGE